MYVTQAGVFAFRRSALGPQLLGTLNSGLSATGLLADFLDFAATFKRRT